MGPGVRLLLTSALILLLVPVAAGVDPRPILPTNPASERPFVSPHGVTFAAVERLLTPESRIPNQPGTSIFFTKDQMAAVLAYTQRAALFPPLRDSALATAGRMFAAAQAAYNLGSRFYDVTLTTRSSCIQLEANAWALLAADRLGNATQIAAVKARARDLAATLVDAVEGGTANGVVRCSSGGSVPPSQWPLPLWALLLHAESSGDTAARRAALARLDAEIHAHFQDGFRDTSGLILAGVNAQYLLVLDVAARLDPAYSSKSEALTDFMLKHLTVATDGTTSTLNLEPSGGSFSAVGSYDPAAQVWAAFALHNHGEEPSVGDAPERLMASLMSSSWSYVTGALVNEGGQVNAEINLLAALATAGPVASAVSSEGARVAIAVPAWPDFVYPTPGTAAASSFLISNEWTYRFTLEPAGPPHQRILLGLDSLGAIRHPYPESAYTPTTVVSRGGMPLSAVVAGSEHPAVEFTDTLQTGALYRLVDYAPVFPVSAHVRRDVQVFLDANSTDAVALDLLRLDVALSRVRIDAVRFGDQVLPPEDLDVRDVEATSYLRQAHVRLELRGLTLSPGINEVVVQYTDTEGPTIDSVTLWEDAEGTVPLRTSELAEGLHYIVGGRSHGYVRAVVHDNGAIREVALEVGRGANTETVVMAPTNDASVFVGELPVLENRRTVHVSVRAVDEHDNLHRSGDIMVESQPSFLKAGNAVLLVFSAVLFASSVVIYMKMRGKRRS